MKPQICLCCCRHFAREIINVRDTIGFVGTTPMISLNTPKEVLNNYTKHVCKYCKFTEYISIIFDYTTAKRMYEMCLACHCCHRHTLSFPTWSQKRERIQENDNYTTNKKRRT